MQPSITNWLRRLVGPAAAVHTHCNYRASVPAANQIPSNSVHVLSMDLIGQSAGAQSASGIPPAAYLGTYLLEVGRYFTSQITADLTVVWCNSCFRYNNMNTN